jgi:CHAT domain-containing protein
VVSLWNVNDVATADLMKSFYQNLGRGMPKDEALRQAKVSLLKSRQRMWQHPYFWAPFVLVGEPN